MKKLFSLLVIALCSANLFAHDFEVNGIYYNFLGGDSVAVTYQGTSYYSSNAYSGSVVIPNDVTYSDATYRVTTIDNYAFHQDTAITSMTIPENVTSIGGNYAFYGLKNLTSVTWNAQIFVTDDESYSVYPIFNGEGVYDNDTYETYPWESKVTSFIFGENVKVIPAGLCYNMNKLTEINIPDSVTTIGSFAFWGIGVTALTVPSNVSSIGKYAFYNLHNLTSVVWNATNCQIDTNDDYYYRDVVPVFGNNDNNTNGVSKITSIVLGDDVEILPDGLCKSMAQLTNITMPNSVTTIGKEAFYGCTGLTSITVPANIVSIGEDAFYNLDNLTSVVWNAKDYQVEDSDSYDGVASLFGNAAGVTSFVFGDDVISIPAGICKNMVQLTSIVIPDNVITIGKEAFSGCSSITSLTVPANISSIGYKAFYDMKGLTSVRWNAKNCVIGDGDYYSSQVFGIREVNEYNEYEYDNHSLTSVVFGDEVEILPDGICAYLVNLKNVNIPNQVKTIGYNAFGECRALEDITIPESVVTIKDDAFRSCEKIQTITIPNSVTKIGAMAFAYCSSLQSAILGEGVETIGDFAFYGCNQLKKFICNSPNAVEESDYFDEYEPNYILCCTQLDTIIAPANIFDKPEHSWSYLAKNTRYIQINGGELTPNAFSVINRSYKTLQHLDLSAASNTEIADEAFKGSYALRQLRLPAELEYIGYMAAAECVNLQSLEIPASVTEVSDRAFENCRSLQNITFGGKTAQEIGVRQAPAFTQTESMLTSIGSWAFYNCHELKNLAIPEGVTEVGAAAFYGCVYLEDLTLPSTVQSIGDNCFALCSKLSKITCLASVPPTIEAKTFYDVNRSIPLYVPATSITSYENDTYWSEFLNPVAAGNESTTGVLSLIDNTNKESRKVFENGTIYILRKGEKYTIDGRKVE